MDKKRKWHLALILCVVGLTIYNILPTVFYYCKPLKAPIDDRRAEQIVNEISNRVDELENESIEWLQSYCQLLGVKPLYIKKGDAPNQIHMSFSKTEEAAKLKKFLPRAGSLIPFFPSQLGVVQSDSPKEVTIQRRIPLRFSDQNNKELFTFVPKYSEGKRSKAYEDLIQERFRSIQQCLTEEKRFLPQEERGALFVQAAAVESLEKIYASNQEIAVRYAQSQSVQKGADQMIASFDRVRDALRQEKSIEGIGEDLKKELDSQIHKIAAAEAFVKKHPTLFNGKSTQQNPFFYELSIDWEHDQFKFKLFPDVQAAILTSTTVEQLLIDEVAKIARNTNEAVQQTADGFSIPLHKLTNASGFLVFKLDAVAKALSEQILSTIRTTWRPTHPDLSQLKIVSSAEYQFLSPQEQSLCLVVSSPASEETHLSKALQNRSLYVIAKGLGKIARSYEQAPNSELSHLFSSEFRALAEILSQHGYSGYQATLFGNEIDFLFENRNFSVPLLTATREEFSLYGAEKQAVLELSDVEHRILTNNKIETKIHEDLVKWDDEFRSSRVSLNSALKYDVPKPTKNPFLSNLSLSIKKLLRGDDRKILRWGLDLSGGKTVQIELRDQNNRIVTAESDIKQGINELFNRVNKMGVSDVSIRQVGNHIALDFPGGQALSAAELVKASSMYFHIVNEEFSLANGAIANSVNQFLQEVWNEALVTGKKDPASVHAIAYRHLQPSDANQRSDAGKVLYERGLRLADPKDYGSNQQLDSAISKIAQLRGSNPSEWHGQTHPLMIVFRNFALEGSQLDNVRANYDPSKGNFLTFEVKGSAPRASLHQWTAKYCKEKILGSSLESVSQGRGWRMAVLLNDTIISAPTLESALKESASISGSFSQREVNQLVSDLKAGSLTFTPHILSEKNVSPELGKHDRMQGIAAAIFALLLVVGSMTLYYRFAGWIASVAVLFNLLILWATLQNLGASLSLASIAGIILTVGMAVDANVLVFERIKEEFALTSRIASAIHAGYEKAFSAIVDSNVTTIIAALILLNFDAGPIKAFAVSMIIGIASSMFTALFMTRFYFTGWLQNPKNTALKMADWIKVSHFDFLKRAKASFAVAIGIIAIGCGLVFVQKSTIFGMDFTGGYALYVELGENSGSDPVHSVEQALLKAGATGRDFQIRQHNPSTHLRILFGTSMEQPGKPFYGMPIQIDAKPGAPSYASNPRIQWVVSSLQNSGLTFAPASLSTLDTNWTSMSGQMSDTMRNNALIGLLIAFVSIFIYIAFRFEYKYAISASLCLLHDVLITIGLMGILHAFKIPVQIDLNTIAALMTIIGYSLNDTIIIFDRIREDVQVHRRIPMRQLVNRALNATLSRTAITSGTTLLVLIALLGFGGASLFSFSLVMVVGVIFGTLSSWFIASPLLLFFHRKEERRIQVSEVTQ